MKFLLTWSCKEESGKVNAGYKHDPGSGSLLQASYPICLTGWFILILVIPRMKLGGTWKHQYSTKF